MADYYSVLKKTVAALPENNGASRRAIYQRARTAIVNQLKAYDPPLTPSEITNEQLRLEEAIRKVEAEAARETLGLNRPAAAQTPTQAPTPASGSGRASSADNAPDNGPNNSSGNVKPASAAVAVNEGARGASADEAKDAGRPPVQRPDATAERREPSMAAPGAFGAFTPKAPAPQTPTPQFSPPQTPANAPVAQAPFASDALQGSGKSAPAAQNGDVANHGGKARKPYDSGRTPYHETRDEGLKPSRVPVILGASVVLLVLIGIGAIVYSQRDSFLALINGTEEAGTTTATGDTPPTEAEQASSGKNADRLLTDGESPAAPDARTVTTTRISPTKPEGETTATPQEGVRQVTPDRSSETPPAETAPAQAEPQSPPAGASGQSGVTGSDTPPAAGPVGGSAPEQVASTTPSEETPASVEPALVAPTSIPSTPSVTSPSVPGAGESQVAAVAQRSILYEEGADSSGTGTAAAGQSVWSVEKSNEEGREETVLKVLAEISDRGIGAEVSIKPNRDASLPASHLVEVKFELPANFPNKGVKDVPGLVMKMTEEARGDALIGASVKVADGYFWLALSNVPSERDRNLALLRERGWIDIPILYEDGKRAILTLEKGTPGTNAVEQAIAAWK